MTGVVLFWGLGMGWVLRLAAIYSFFSVTSAGAIERPTATLIAAIGLVLLKLELEASSINNGIKKMIELMLEDDEDEIDGIDHPPYEIVDEGE